MANVYSLAYAKSQKERASFRTAELPSTDPFTVEEKKWSTRKTLAFVLLTCGAFWAAFFYVIFTFAFK